LFLLALVFIYLVLAAQFESFVDTFVILRSVPLAFFGAVACLVLLNKGSDMQLWSVTGSWNIYTEIGMITLVGLISKHGWIFRPWEATVPAHGKPVTELG
jgi:multidrug efflux pump